MPEGPEIKLLAAVLNKLLAGQRLLNLCLLKGPAVHGMDSKYIEFRVRLTELRSIIANADKIIKIVSVESKGKLIHIELQVLSIDNSSYRSDKFIYITSHLGLNGNWSETEGGHTQATITYESINSFDQSVTKILYYDDFRGYGKIDIIKAELLEETLDKLGNDVLGEHFACGQFIKAVREFPIKPIVNIIVDQSVISGLGNVYRTEALYIANVHPLTKTVDMTDIQLEQLHNAIRFVVLKSFVDGGYDKHNKDVHKYTPYIYGREIAANGESVTTFTLSGRTVYLAEHVDSEQTPSHAA